MAKNETDKAVEILERTNREANRELCALVDELRRERDEARQERCEIERAARFALSVLRSNAIEMSERMAIEKLEDALGVARKVA